MRRLFEPDLRRRTWGGFLSAMTLMVGSFAATTFVPSWIAQLSATGGPAVIARDVSYFAMLLNVGAIIGYLVLIWLTASRIGRRGSYFVFALGALLTAIVMFTLVRSTSGVLVAAPIAGFFMLGGFGVFAVYLPELFPTAVRATGQGFCFNFARVITGWGYFPTAVQRAIYKMHGAAAEFYAVLQSFLLYVGSRKGRQQRRMNVQDSVWKRVEKDAAQDPHGPAAAVVGTSRRTLEGAAAAHRARTWRARPGPRSC